MAKNRMVTKHCPKCQQQVPVACKSCPCGHEFFANRRTQASRTTEDPPGGRRRTERVRKERQSYLAALVLEERARQRAAAKRRRLGTNKRGRPRNPSSHDDSSEEGRRQQGRAKLQAKTKPPVTPIEPEMPDEEEEDVFAGASKEKLELYSDILADINRKLCSQMFQQQFAL